MGGARSGDPRTTRASAPRQVTVIRFSHGAATSVGRVRQVNEDSFLALPPLFVVADGMGGHGAGDVASRIAIEEMTACAALRPLFAEAVLTALEHANRHIIERDEANRMGTTVTGLAGLETAGGDHLMVFNIGDSRVYRLSGDRLEQLTVDHSEVQELVLAGVITREQARTHPRRNIVTRALGSDPCLPPDHWLLPAIRRRPVPDLLRRPVQRAAGRGHPRRCSAPAPRSRPRRPWWRRPTRRAGTTT